jgi:hypothetical protein
MRKDDKRKKKKESHCTHSVIPEHQNTTTPLINISFMDATSVETWHLIITSIHFKIEPETPNKHKLQPDRSEI